MVATQAVEKRVCRSRDAYIGGVCAGLAEHFDLDPIVVRILAVLITIMTLGLGAIVYVVLWARLPLEDAAGVLYEITPESAESNAFGSVDCQTGRAVSKDRETDVDGATMLARLAVAVCLVLLFLIVAMNISPLVPGIEWWQFWPVGFLILVNLVQPPNKYRVAVFAICVVGLIVCCGVLWDLFDIYSLSPRALVLCVVFALAQIGVLQILSVVITWVYRQISARRQAGKSSA